LELWNGTASSYCSDWDEKDQHVPFARTSAMQSRAISVVGPLVWNGLPLALRSLPKVFSQTFLQQLKTT